MQFEYVKKECDVGTIYVPTLPISINGFPVGNAMIDTGADVTLLPMEVNKILQLELDYDHAMDLVSAGGGKFRVIPPISRVMFTIEHSGFRPIEWKGTVFFAPRQPVILLGQFEFLAELKMTLDPKNHSITVTK